MIVVCQGCGKQQEQEALFCPDCGTKLISEEGLRTMPMESSLGGLTTTRLQTSGTLMRPNGPARLNLHIIRTGQILPLAGPGEFIVGRVSSGQSILPDVDLEPYAAYESGVSRLHARIRIQAEEILITDLGSANGTRLNNDKLAPHQPYSIQNKDVLRFGRLSVQALTGD
ncbi:MAG: FHA domain-containing protein [Anaerolineales bacterium]|nr:FHA domain-containing protein [Anaerolineales bacterium]MCW5888121.1 FHA domain-containing protein [Anaerolineales bacterium]